MRHRRPPRVPSVAAATLLWAARAAAQQAPVEASAPAHHASAPPGVGLPARIASFAPVADVRAFAVARAGDRAVLAYVGAEGRGRNVVRTVLLHGLGNGAGLERVGEDHTVTPLGAAVAVSWNGTDGALAFVVPRPHRGEPTGRGRHRHTPEETDAARANPLGDTALTAADVMFVRLDAQGAPAGRPVSVFEENSRTFHLALARDGDGWLVAWTGSVSADNEVRGTVRSMHLDAQGAPHAAASDTGFVGEVGNGLAIVPRAGDRASALLVWSGERCRAREGAAPYGPPERDPSAGIETRDRTLRNQQPPVEHPGPPIECSPLGMYSAEVFPTGRTGAVLDGPALASDALSVVRDRAGALVVAALGEDHARATLAAAPLTAQGRLGAARVVEAGRAPGAVSDALPPAASATPSLVPPPAIPGARDIARAPAALDAVRDGDGVAFVALSHSRARVVYGAQPSGAAEPPTLTLIAPGARIWDVAIAGAEQGAPWLFAQTGTAWNGPLVFVDAADVGTRAVAPEVPWAGDEPFRVALVRARAARAEYTRAENSAGPMSEAPGAATNPQLAGVLSVLQSRRQRWIAACEPLTERARYLSRHGVPNDVNEIARETCDLTAEGPDPGAPPGTAAPAGGAPAGSAP